jgi:hypothetical protein
MAFCKLKPIACGDGDGAEEMEGCNGDSSLVV